MDIVKGVCACLIPDCKNPGSHHAPGGSAQQSLCCRHFGEFVAHLLDPKRNPVFPIQLG
jgi:hypothetical protein